MQSLSDRSKLLLANSLLVLLVCGDAPKVHAQGVWPVGVESGAGFSWGNTNGLYRSPVGLAFDVVAAGVITKSSFGTVVLAGSYARLAGGPHDHKCVLKPGGGCQTTFPEFTAVGVLAGFENQTGSRRLVAGPIHVQGDDTAIGLEVRANAFTPAIVHMSLGFLVRGAIIPGYDGLTLGLVTGELVLRLR